MPIIPTNITKSSVTYTNVDKQSESTWGDTFYTWGDLIMNWGGTTFTPSNAVKSSTLFTNQPKS